MQTKTIKMIILSDVYSDNPLAYAKEGDAGVDLRSTVDVNIGPGECVPIGLGVRFSIETPNLFMLLLPRSGMGKEGLILGNTAGVIDGGYQGEVIALAYNRNDKESGKVIRVIKGQRICQAVFLPFVTGVFETVETFTESARGSAGFGSTG